MASNTVTVNGMFGAGHTYFSDSPVVIDINGLYWGSPPSSPFTVVRINVLYNGSVIGDFHADTGGQTNISFDVSSALRSIWSDYDFGPAEVAAALEAQNEARSSEQYGKTSGVRSYREYSLDIFTEYLDSQDGEFTQTGCGTFPGGQCALGWLTEWERSIVGNKENADVSFREHNNIRNGDASTKPTSSPERVGSQSITSWVDVQSSGTKSIFYGANAEGGYGSYDRMSAHAPIVLRDSIPYTDFLFVNRRGAVETCSAQMLEAMDVSAETELHARVERPQFIPSRSLMSISHGGRRSWSMSSGYQTREWAEWWVTEFLMARRWWMFYKGRYVPVIVEPAKKTTNIYDRSKQQMPSVEFTVTLALEG